MNAGVLVIGAGHAGDGVAAALRQLGWRAPICLVGDEDAAPYERPPLSKAFLKGERHGSALALRPAGFHAEQGIEFIAGTRAVSIDRDTRTVEFADGARRRYEHLVLATGSRHRELAVPGSTDPNVLRLRTLSDAMALKDAMIPGRRLGIVGGGYVGLEVAASALALGVEPVLVERDSRLLSRVASEPFARFVEALHRERGTEIHLGARVAALHPGKGILLEGGGELHCDAILVGVGASANDSLAREAGLDCDDGIIVDGQCRTRDHRIFAIGDCCRCGIPGFGERLRLESIPSAQEHAKRAAAAITGAKVPAPMVPWFWSDQFGARIQIAGLLRDVHEAFIRRHAGSGGFSVYHLDAGRRLRAVETFRSPPDFMVGRALIEAGIPIPEQSEARPLAELKALIQ